MDNNWQMARFIVLSTWCCETYNRCYGFYPFINYGLDIKWHKM